MNNLIAEMNILLKNNSFKVFKIIIVKLHNRIYIILNI